MQEGKKNNTILVPTDLSEVANNALDHAIAIAKVYGNEILLLHIVEEGFLSSLLGTKNFKDGPVGQMLQDKLDTICKDITEKYGVKAHAAIREGRIYKTILEVSDEIDCDSIVMGTTGAEGLRQLVGSNSSRVISQSNYPVVVVKEKKIGKDGYKQIVFPLDLSMESKQKVSWAIHVAKKFDSTIHIVVEEETDDFLRNKLLANLNAIEDVFAKNNVKYEARILTDDKYPGKFYEDTLQYADEINADLIMIMTQQEKEGFSEFLLGSYAQQIVNHHSSIPVMCIVPKDTGMKALYWSGM